MKEKRKKEKRIFITTILDFDDAHETHIMTTLAFFYHLLTFFSSLHYSSPPQNIVMETANAEH
jgi:hypothetical protein